MFFFFKQRTAYEMRISDWSSDVCSSDLAWRVWVAARDRLFREHPQSPRPTTERAAFRGLPYFGYDPSARLLAALAPAGEAHLDLEISRDGRSEERRYGEECVSQRSSRCLLSHT